MATAVADAARFDPEAAGPSTENSSVLRPKPRVKMSISIPVPDDGEFAVKIQGQLSVKKARALHIQVMRIRKEDEHLGEDLREAANPKERFAFLPMEDVFFRYSKATFPSPLGINAGVRLL